ncbi:MAG: signal recognition particle-docking protein FtsY [Cyanobacteria bacterium]|nr:signal recognition particle-docking protein FtsY [Cyanobacteriota bacterium]
MVFDWFKRAVGPSEPEPPAPEAAAPSATVASEDSPVDASAADASPPESPEVPAGAPLAASLPPRTGVAAASAVDEDALAWARQAYARLKAQQEVATEPAPASAPSSAGTVATVQASPAGSPVSVAEQTSASAGSGSTRAELQSAPLEPAETAPIASAERSSPATAPSSEAVTETGTLQAAVAAAEPSPVSVPGASSPPAPGLSLLELAAAQREQRRQEILAASPTAPAAVQPSGGAVAASPATTSAAPATAQDEPSLGAFDADFTWSAEVLAAQGRRVEDVSLEEIDWLTRLRRGLEKTRKGFVAQLLDTLGDDPLSSESLEDIESNLLRADVGVQATDRVLEALRQRLNEEVVDPAEGLRFLKEQLRAILEEPITASGRDLLAPEKDRLNVWLLVGVNGVGKTTTLGKLANLAVRSGYSCLIAAADTFRAAAVQQVSVWGERSGVPVVSNPSANADPAAVVYDAIGAAKAKGTELVLVDTAGRLQTKHNLMEELSKVRRIVDKLAPEAVVESLLVLDASQGQNGLRQAMAFASAAGLTGVVLTKLDGSARGGVALAVASEARLPIRFIGAGETIRDLRPFNSFEFVEALLAG